MHTARSGASKIALVALNMNNNADDSEKFRDLSAQDKIALIKERIQAICEDLTVKEPDAMWIISWREYGITDKGKAKGLPRDIKILLKKEMQALTEAYPQLTIVAGTVSTVSHTDSEEKLKKMIAYYDNHSWTEEAEVSQLEDTHIRNEKAKVRLAIKKGFVDQAGIDFIRNTCFIFNGKHIWSHDKVAPIHEKAYEHRQALFQPGSKKNPKNLSYFTITHPITHQPIPIGVEICREHLLGVLKKSNPEEALIHLIMSDTIGLKINQLNGRYALQLDSNFKPSLVLSHQDNDAFPLHFYQDNIEEPHQLRGPLAPIYPFVHQVTDKLDEAMLRFPEKKEVFEDIRECFIKAVDAHDTLYDPIEVVYGALEKGLKDNRLQTDTNAGFFQPSSLEEMVNQLLDLIAADKLRNPHGMDYRSYAEAAPLSQHNKY